MNPLAIALIGIGWLCLAFALATIIGRAADNDEDEDEA